MTRRRTGTFEPDSPASFIVVPSLGWKTGKFVERKGPVLGLTVHTTGMGIIRRWRKQGARFVEVTPFETALRVYSTIMTAGPHYVLCGSSGFLAQVTPENIVAWHVGSRGSAVYGRAVGTDGPKYAWWRRKYIPRTSPRELLAGRGWEDGTWNGHTIGVEVVPDEDNGPWTDFAWEALGSLASDIVLRYDLRDPLTQITGHSDAHPRSRTDARGRGWDPGPWNGWTTPAEIVERLALPASSRR